MSEVDEETIPSEPVPAPSTGRKVLVFGTIAVIVLVMVIGGRILRVRMANDVINAAGNPQPTAVASEPVASPSTVTYSTDPVERGKQCIAAGAASTTAPTTVDAAFASWTKNLMAAQKSRDLNQMSCAFYDISATSNAWSTFKDFDPATITTLPPTFMDGSGGMSSGILATFSVQTIMADHRSAVVDVTLRLSSAGSADSATGVWMMSDVNITYSS